MKVIHVLCLSALISTAPGLLAGCGGGSSNSGNSLQVTQANVTFTSPDSNIDTSAFRLKGVAPDNGPSKGISVSYSPYPPNEENKVGGMVILAKIPLSGNFRREIVVFLRTANPFDQPVGKVYNLADDVNNPTFGQEGTARVNYQNALVADHFVSESGTIEIIAKTGDSVTLRLNNARFRRFVANATGSITANGTITYKQSNILVTSDKTAQQKSQ